MKHYLHAAGRNISKTCASIVKHSMIKLQHLVVAVAVETKTYSEYGSFKRKLKICATLVNNILHANRFIVKKSGKPYRMRNFSDQTFNAFVQEICIENKDCDFTRPG